MRHAFSILCGITALLAKICGANPAGYSKIALFNISDIDVLPAADAVTGIAATDITMKATKKGFEIPFTEETGEFDEPLDGEIDAQTIKPMIKFTLAGRIATTVAIIQKMIGGRYIAIITFLDGKKIIVGSINTPLRLKKADFKSGAYGSNTRKGFEFEMMASSARVAARTTTIIKQLNLPQIQDMCRELVNTIQTGTGSYNEFLTRWGYDDEQKKSIAELQKVMAEYFPQMDDYIQRAVDPTQAPGYK